MRTFPGQMLAMKIVAVLLAAGLLIVLGVFYFQSDGKDAASNASPKVSGTEAKVKTAEDAKKEPQANSDKTPKGSEKNQKDKDKNKKKDAPPPPPDFETPKVSVLPFDTMSATRIVDQGIKPGHWAAAILEMRANNFDFSGELEFELIHSDGRPIGLPGQRFRVTSRRGAILPKGQKKFFETVFFSPPPKDGKEPRLRARLLSRGGGEVQAAPFDKIALMPAHQYFFVVLAGPNRDYSFLKNREAITPLSSEEFIGDTRNLAHYRVSIPQISQRAPLPPHFLAWTSIAYVLWDDANPDVLLDEQKQALVDWLHWGGQLIISGPDSLSALQTPGGFLEPYLPATAGEAIKIDEDTLQAMNEHWAIHDEKGLKNRLKPVAPWSGVKLVPRDGAEGVQDTGDLFYERRVGRGRIVVSAFGLQNAEFKKWRNFDSFLNGGLLRRPPRKFRREFTSESIDVEWVNASAWTGNQSTGNLLQDPEVNTNVRLMARDTGYGANTSGQITRRNLGEPLNDFVGSPMTPRPSIDGGLGAWSDSNSVSTIVRSSLKKAAGIEIPTAAFVVGCLAAYLIVLVPVNWAFFRLIGRVEWAWIAAPLIAIAGTIFVTKMAHLDIGFTRSEREVALVEMHTGHSRAHVTRYTALYTSLSSQYTLQCDDLSAEALPFANNSDAYRELRSEVEFRRSDKTSLTGFDVSSNSTEMVHSEQMANMRGAFRWKKNKGADGDVENGTDTDLHSVGVIRKINGRMQLAWIGEFPRQTTQSLHFSQLDSGKDAKDPSAEFKQFFSKNPENIGDVRDEQWSGGDVLQELLKLLRDDSRFRNGDVRLFGWTKQEIPGVTFEPAAAQRHCATLVVVHLGYADFPAPRPDVNLRPLARNNGAN